MSLDFQSIRCMSKINYRSKAQFMEPFHPSGTPQLRATSGTYFQLQIVCNSSFAPRFINWSPANLGFVIFNLDFRNYK